MPIRNLAIACQGGGSHCAFGAGALLEILSRLDDEYCLTWRGERYRISGLSGTSGGAINALIAWHGLIHPAGPEVGIRGLLAFWEGLSATKPFDAVTNFLAVNATRLTEILPHLEFAPNRLSRDAHLALLEQIERQVPFAQLGQYVTTDSPKLLVGAADVLSGCFKVFKSGPQGLPRPEEMLATTAVPQIFPAVPLDETVYWDGLLSQNPPVRDFLHGCKVDEKPDAILVIRINPQAHDGIPERLVDIVDRQNEIAGNQSLAQEKFFIEQVNDWVARGVLHGPFKRVDWHEIALAAKADAGPNLDYGSKLNRDPSFIRWLIAEGRHTACDFLDQSAAQNASNETPEVSDAAKPTKRRRAA